MSHTTTAPAASLLDMRERVSAAAALNEGYLERDRSGTFSREAWRALAETGFFAMPVPTEHGGSGFSLVDTLDIAEHLGRVSHDAGLNFSAATHLASTAVPLARFGRPEVQEKYLPSVAEGVLIGSHAVTEAGAGSDALSMSSAGRFEDDEIVLTGQKTFITNGPVADLTVVYVRTETEAGPLSLSAVLVPRGTPGATFSAPLEKNTLRTSPIGTLTLNNCRVPTTHLLGGRGMGFLILDYVMSREILLAFTVNVGEMHRRLHSTIGHVRQRQQFGQPLSSFQGVQDAIVEMHLSIETARLALQAAVIEIDKGRRATSAVAIAKIIASRANLSTAQQAIELHGGIGVLTSTGIESGLRDAIGGPIYSGSNAIQRQKIARSLGL